MNPGLAHAVDEGGYPPMVLVPTGAASRACRKPGRGVQAGREAQATSQAQPERGRRFVAGERSAGLRYSTAQGAVGYGTSLGSTRPPRRAPLARTTHAHPRRAAYPSPTPTPCFERRMGASALTCCRKSTRGRRTPYLRPPPCTPRRAPEQWKSARSMPCGASDQ